MLPSVRFSSTMPKRLLLLLGAAQPKRRRLLFKTIRKQLRDSIYRSYYGCIYQAHAMDPQGAGHTAQHLVSRMVPLRIGDDLSLFPAGEPIRPFKKDGSITSGGIALDRVCHRPAARRGDHPKSHLRQLHGGALFPYPREARKLRSACRQ